MKIMTFNLVSIFFSLYLYLGDNRLLALYDEQTKAVEYQPLFKQRKDASTEEVARSIFKKVGYELGDQIIMRHGSNREGWGYFEAFVNHEGIKKRIVAYGPGEYGIPHYHCKEEWFRVSYGECDSYEFGKVIFPGDGKPYEIIFNEKIIYKRCKVGDIMSVPPYVLHCLVADDIQGCCREVSYEKSPNSYSTGFKNIPIPCDIDSENLLRSNSFLKNKNDPAPFFKRTTKTTTKEMARDAFIAAGYTLGEAEVNHKGDEITKEGSFDVTLFANGEKIRVAYYPPGGFAFPHYHNKDEWFLVTYGGCDAWKLGEVVLAEDKKTFDVVFYEKPIYKRYSVGDVMTVDPFVVHCLVADDCKGLCRQVPFEKNPQSSSRHLRSVLIPSENHSDVVKHIGK